MITAKLGGKFVTVEPITVRLIKSLYNLPYWVAFRMEESGEIASPMDSSPSLRLVATPV
ncbi:MAG: hypothetical protein WBP57_01440 [Ignavibacteria bacterium]